MIKRICSLILAVGLLFTIVGCASNNGDTQSGSAQSTAQQIADKAEKMIEQEEFERRKTIYKY